MLEFLYEFCLVLTRWCSGVAALTGEQLELDSNVQSSVDVLYNSFFMTTFRALAHICRSNAAAAAAAAAADYSAMSSHSLCLAHQGGSEFYVVCLLGVNLATRLARMVGGTKLKNMRKSESTPYKEKQLTEVAKTIAAEVSKIDATRST